jgi:hypothetical protein
MGTTMQELYFDLRPQPATPEEELCDCSKIGEIYLAYKLGYNPIHCLGCNGEIVPEKLGFDGKMAQSIAEWNGVYGAL